MMFIPRISPLAVCLLVPLYAVESLQTHQPSASICSSGQNAKVSRRASVVHIHSVNQKGIEDNSPHSDRRTFLEESGLYLSGMGLGASLCISDAHADDVEMQQSDDGNFDCLLDLPPVTPNCARLYLCRHGQTENNRLHLVQGARVDPPLNDNGYKQAKRLGMAISRLSYGSSDRVGIPSVLAHSKMLRARETAETLLNAASNSWKSTTPQLKLLGEVPALGEVDFGSLEGTDAKAARRQMMSTFASWSIGDIDKRLAGGES
jgi:hypothetical protein